MIEPLDEDLAHPRQRTNATLVHSTQNLLETHFYFLSRTLSTLTLGSILGGARLLRVGKSQIPLDHYTAPFTMALHFCNVDLIEMTYL